MIRRTLASLQACSKLNVLTHFPKGTTITTMPASDHAAMWMATSGLDAATAA
jgi:hypothetical protein